MWNQRLGLSAFCLAALPCALVTAEDAKLPLKLIVEAGSSDRVDALASFALPQSLVGSTLRLVETTGGKDSPVPAQVDSSTSRLYWIAAGKTATGSKRTYRLESGSAANGPAVTVSDSADAVEATFDS